MQIDALTKARQQMEVQMQQMQMQMQHQMNQQMEGMKTHYETRIAQLTAENLSMKDKVEYLTNKITSIIKEQIAKKKEMEQVWTLTPPTQST
jgi:TolB-like protein